MSIERNVGNIVQLVIKGTILGWMKKKKKASETVAFIDLGEYYTIQVYWKKKTKQQQQKEQRSGDGNGFNIFQELRDNML